MPALHREHGPPVFCGLFRRDTRLWELEIATAISSMIRICIDMEEDQEDIIADVAVFLIPNAVHAGCGERMFAGPDCHCAKVHAKLTGQDILVSAIAVSLCQHRRIKPDTSRAVRLEIGAATLAGGRLSCLGSTLLPFLRQIADDVSLNRTARNLSLRALGDIPAGTMIAVIDAEAAVSELIRIEEPLSSRAALL